MESVYIVCSVLNEPDFFASRMIHGRPALRIDEKACPVVCRAVRGGWRYKVNIKTEAVAAEVDKSNPYSHSGDGFGYVCRYFHRGTEREMRYGLGGSGARTQRRFVPPASYGTTYHQR